MFIRTRNIFLNLSDLNPGIIIYWMNYLWYEYKRNIWTKKLYHNKMHKTICDYDKINIVWTSYFIFLSEIKCLFLVLSMIQLISMYWLPRTPHYLLLHQRDTEAMAVMSSIHPASAVKQELATIRQSVETSNKSSYSQLFTTEVSISS